LATPEQSAAKPPGLSESEARSRLAHYGPNEVAQESESRLRQALARLWAPVPWMLEATVVLELVLGHLLEAGIVLAVLLVNAAIGLFQESRASAALALLRSRLQVQARVRREGRWRLVPAAEVVPGDFVHVRGGDVVPADVELQEGVVSVDNSALTGESLLAEVAQGATIYSGSIVASGEASGSVLATGAGTYFGRTAELVRNARTATHLESVVLGLVRWFVALDGVVALAVVSLAAAQGKPARDIITFALVLLLASVPVALPAAFTLASALGALELAHAGILVTRMSAVQEAAAMDVLCVDKTGTITTNHLQLDHIQALPPCDQDRLLALAAAASDAATQDPLDLAVLAAAEQGGAKAGQRQEFLPFDPVRKRSEATIREDGRLLRVMKGAPQVIAALSGGYDSALARRVDDLAANGSRVLAVAAGEEGSRPKLLGLLALRDTPRPDARELIEHLHAYGVEVVMLTGDTLPTAQAIASEVGIDGAGVRVSDLRAGHALERPPAIVAEVLPEDKLELVKLLQSQGHVVGMTGDGVNDAPALRQAEVGIAVASATDVAKQAASVVLTSEGIADLLALVESGRRIHQRSVTYALNVASKKIEVPLLLAFGVFAWGSFLFTPLLMALLLLGNDFVSLAIVTDVAVQSRRPERWRNSELLLASLVVAAPLLLLAIGVVVLARDVWPGLHGAELQTFAFLLLLYQSQATVYLVRVAGRLWSAAPGRWLLAASLVDLVAFSAFALAGVLLSRVAPGPIGVLFGVIVVGMLLVDALKAPLFVRLGVHRS
jgi:H+-transporting ATPase